MNPLPLSDPNSWSNYVAGVVNEYIKLLVPMSEEEEALSISLKVAICSDVPLGSGLSSSAALEVAVATFIESLISKRFPQATFLGNSKAKALLCQKVENNFCDSPCGIMDQFVSAAASSDSAILIDCRTLEIETVRMGSQEKDDPVFLICNSNVKHSIGGGEYPVRVQQCEAATNFLNSLGLEQIVSLRDATMSDVEKMDEHVNDKVIDKVIQKRAKHVVAENDRTQRAKVALKNGNWAKFGMLMNESHASLRDEYEVSCKEIDVLVELAQSFDGVYGSRLTGGGFGGCTVTLVKRSRVEHLCEHLEKEYKIRTGAQCYCFESSPVKGAREILVL